jgi:hypothetical protein
MYVVIASRGNAWNSQTLVGLASLVIQSGLLASYIACLLLCNIILWELFVSLCAQSCSQNCASVLCPLLSIYPSHVVCSISPHFVPGLCCTILPWVGLLELPALYLWSNGFTLGRGPMLLVGHPLEWLVLRGQYL